MKHIILIDKRSSFVSDINTRLMLMDDDISFEIINTLTDPAAIVGIVNQTGATDVVICDNIIDSMPTWDLGVSITAYASDAEGLAKINEAGLNSYGIIKSSSALIDAINNNKLITTVTNRSQTISQPVNPPTSHTTTSQENSGITPAQTIGADPVHSTEQGQSGVNIYGQNMQQMTIPFASQYQGQMQQNVSMQNTPQIQPANIQYQTVFVGYGANGQPMYAQMPVQMPQDINRQMYGQQIPNGMPTGQPMTPVMPNPVQPQPANIGIQPAQMLGGMQGAPMVNGFQGTTEAGAQSIIQNPAVQSQINQAISDANTARMNKAAEMVDRDVMPRRKTTKIISTYSAKGGVGKTTVAKEVSTYLACTSNNSERYKVCIVDFNVDFGDVSTVLNYSMEKDLMIEWITDIRNKLVKMVRAQGMDPNAIDGDVLDDMAETISYTKEEVLGYLQKDSKTGLYALPAPQNHEDSMDIQQRETYVILNAIKNCGEFDFVICDTGNNTRDTTYNALELSDLILLICTQDTTTANDNDSFLCAAEKIGFDSSKIKIVVNQVKSQSEAGISVQEVEQMMKQYECYGHIKYDDRIRKANNFGDPLVLQPKQTEFRDSIQEIVFNILGQKVTGTNTQKKSFFSKLFKKK